MFGSIASELNKNWKGITIVRKNGYKLVEYASGDPKESYYQIQEVKSNHPVDWLYASPAKRHREAIEEFKKSKFLMNRS